MSTLAVSACAKMLKELVQAVKDFIAQQQTFIEWAMERDKQLLGFQKELLELQKRFLKKNEGE